MHYIHRDHSGDLGGLVEDRDRTAWTPAKVSRLLFVATVFLLMITALGRAMRHTDDAVSPSSALEPATAVGPAADGGALDAAAQQQLGGLLNGGGFTSRDPNALNKSLGDPAILFSRDTEIRVTAVRAAAGTAACTTGKVVTVHLLVEPVSGSARLPPDNFLLLGADGSVAAPVPACATGFAESSEQRTLVFAAEKPDRLIIGTDPAVPVVMWQV